MTSFAFLLAQMDQNISDSHFKTKQVTPFILEFDFAVEGMQLNIDQFLQKFIFIISKCYAIKITRTKDELEHKIYIFHLVNPNLLN